MRPVQMYKLQGRALCPPFLRGDRQKVNKDKEKFRSPRVPEGRNLRRAGTRSAPTGSWTRSPRTGDMLQKMNA
jgi:hypothetical protein